MIDPESIDSIVDFGGAESEQDEAEILANQDETDTGGINVDDPVMGAGPTELEADGADDFVRGEVDLVDQMDRAQRMHDYPERAAGKPIHDTIPAL